MATPTVCQKKLGKLCVCENKYIAVCPQFVGSSHVSLLPSEDIKMSYVDLATLTMHRRNELDARINLFIENCDHATNEIKKMKTRAQGFVQQLNCEPSDLKERFLSCMRQLDEYMYIITDFNLALSKSGDSAALENTPVHDSLTMSSLVPQQNGQLNLIDALSEPVPSTSAACFNHCPPAQPTRIKVSKKEQSLIEFSSTSSSSESVLNRKENASKEVQCEVVNKLKDLKIEEISAPLQMEACDLPPQSLLEIDHKYPANIMHVDGTNMWMITEDCMDLIKLIEDMKDYYMNNYVDMPLDRIKSLACCAFYDLDGQCYYRGLFINLVEDGKTASVFAVDTGEIRMTDTHHLQPIMPQFCTRPPFARCCHLAGVDLSAHADDALIKRQEDFLNLHIGRMCTIEVDDNTSESLGVYVILPSNEILNELFIEAGLGAPIDRTSMVETSTPIQGPPQMDDSELDVSQCPEYEDPVMAVTGYHNRDEADICKYYKGGPEKTCFKGTKCTKKHIMKHPHGWTLDRVEVVGKLTTEPLPPPGAWRKVLVTAVCHFDRFYVQILLDRPRRDKLPNFGEVVPPATLEALVRDMNSPATRLAYKPLTISPAPGELVAALYPLDNNWYRAYVQSVSRVDQNVQVMYVDYGTVLSVREESLRSLPARLARLPAQAVLCRLAGVRAATHCSRHWAAAKQQLAALILDKTLDARVIEREYDELVVELLDSEQYNVSEQLAAQELVVLTPYAIVDDTNVTRKVVVP